MNNLLVQRGVFSVLVLLASTLLSHSVSAQNVADNIRPVGSVCLAGQACVGTVAGAMTEASVADAAEPALEAAAATVAEVAEVAEEATEAAAEPAADAAPMEVAAAATEFDAAGAYQMSCNACHGTGAAGAPMLGDAEAWEARMEKGMEALMSNVINGVGAMPARGICMTCSDDDLQAIVNYMLAQN
ncbi:MAG: c-type cytochrome [Pseudomonadota bacterium]|nr:c-type cytochrome [Pseudomonadota bacterium]